MEINEQARYACLGSGDYEDWMGVGSVIQLSAVANDTGLEMMHIKNRPVPPQDGRHRPARLDGQADSFFLIAAMTASLEVALTVSSMPSFS